MLVAKEIIRPGHYVYLDGDGKPQRLHATPEFIRHLHDSGNAMLRAGLSIPLPFEHQPEARPLTKAQKAAKQLRDNSGHVNRYALLPGHRLFSIMDIGDPQAAEKIKNRTIRWVSPHITSFVDGDGKQWNNVIAHVALTSRPRITRQEPFPSIAAALSQVAAVDVGKSVDAAICFAGLCEAKGQAWQPIHSAEFSAWSSINLAADEKPDKPGDSPTKPATKPATKPDAGDGSVPAMSPDGAPMQPSVIDDDGDISVYALLQDLLPAADVDIGDGVTADNFLERLYKAVLEKVKNKGTAPMSSEQNPNNPTPNPNTLPPNPVVQEQQPLYMSLSIEQINAIADPSLRATAQMAQAVLRNQLTEATAARAARVERLAKRLPAAKREQLNSLTSVQLSLSADGKIVDPASGFLELLEASLPDVPQTMQQKLAAVAVTPGGAQFSGGVTVAPQPNWGDEMTAERAEAVANEFMANNGMKSRVVGSRLSAQQEEAVAKLADKLLGLG